MEVPRKDLAEALDAFGVSTVGAGISAPIPSVWRTARHT
jgi:hypothetical protein